MKHRFFVWMISGVVFFGTSGLRGEAPSGSGLEGYRVLPAWEKAIAKYETAATTRPAPAGCTVFIGSSQFARWTTLEKDFAEFKAVNRAFGGSKTDDVLYYAHRILHPLQPRRIVYYCGSNDLAAKRSPQMVEENFEQFVIEARRETPGVKIYFVAAIVSPKRTQFTEAYRKANDDIAAWVKGAQGVYFIDGTPGLYDEKGEPIASLFIKDGIHLTPEGDAIWKVNIERGLKNPAP